MHDSKKKSIISCTNGSIIKYIIFLLIYLISGCAHHTLQSSSPEELTPTSNYVTPIVYYLPKGKIHVQYKQTSKDPNSKDFTVETLYEPDPSKWYVLNYLKNISYDDTVTVTLADNGLLSKIDITSQSQVGPIITRVMEIAKEAAKLFVPLPAPVPGPKVVGPPPIADNPFDVTIDPEDIKAKPDMQKREEDRRISMANITTGNYNDNYNKLYEESNSIEKTLLPYGVISVQLKRLKPKNGMPTLHAKKVCLEQSEDRRTIYYRPVWPYEFRFIHAKFVVVQTVYLPNNEPVIPLSISRPAFTQAVTNLTFKNGILTEVHLQRSSELLAGLNIPLDIVKAIAAIPSEMLQFRVNYGTNYIQYLNQQIQEIQLKQQLLELKQKNQ